MEHSPAPRSATFCVRLHGRLLLLCPRTPKRRTPAFDREAHPSPGLVAGSAVTAAGRVAAAGEGGVQRAVGQYPHRDAVQDPPLSRVTEVRFQGDAPALPDSSHRLPPTGQEGVVTESHMGFVLDAPPTTRTHPLCVHARTHGPLTAVIPMLPPIWLVLRRVFCSSIVACLAIRTLLTHLNPLLLVLPPQTRLLSSSRRPRPVSTVCLS